MLCSLGAPLLRFLGLLLGEVHLLWAEEHLHQVVGLYPVLQGQTPATQGGLWTRYSPPLRGDFLSGL